MVAIIRRLTVDKGKSRVGDIKGVKIQRSQMCAISDNWLYRVRRCVIVQAQGRIVELGKEWVAIPITSAKYDMVDFCNDLDTDQLMVVHCECQSNPQFHWQALSLHD